MTWRKSLVPGILAPYQYEGKTYAMPSNLGAWVCWYDGRQFRQHGWKPPRTWREFEALCDKIKAAGVAPLAFQGKYPVYAWWTLLSLYERLVPLAKWYDMQNIKPGAFTEPEFIEAAKLVQELGTKYFEPGAMAMTHTESQLEYVNGRAAMVFCGLWLKNEEKNAIPKGFEMRCFPVPQIEGGAGDQKALYSGGGENFFVLADAKHPKEAADFLKFMVSVDSSRSYIQQLDTLSPVRNSVKGIKISPELQSAVDVLDGASSLFCDRLGDLYLEFAKSTMPDALAALLSGKSTPEQFGKTLETAMDEVRANPDIYKPPPMEVPK
jgi:N-acetylglucosamine transport system substrate-binding protein